MEPSEASIPMDIQTTYLYQHARITVIGESSVGKTSLINRMIGNGYSQSPTLFGHLQFRQTLNSSELLITEKTWDVDFFEIDVEKLLPIVAYVEGGEMITDELMMEYQNLKGSDLIYFVGDITRPETFADFEVFKNMTCVETVMIASKLDLKSGEDAGSEVMYVMSSITGDNFAKYEVSSLTGENVESCLKDSVCRIRQSSKKRPMCCVTL